MSRGTIILVPFPFTNLSSEKLRPAVVISRERLDDRDVCVVFITSKLSSLPSEDTVLISQAHSKFSQTGLKVDSAIRANKLATLDRKVILGELGLLPDDLLRQLNQKLRLVLGL